MIELGKLFMFVWKALFWSAVIGLPCMLFNMLIQVLGVFIAPFLSDKK